MELILILIIFAISPTLGLAVFGAAALVGAILALSR
jgi:hypothetical protein